MHSAWRQVRLTWLGVAATWIARRHREARANSKRILRPALTATSSPQGSSKCHRTGASQLACLAIVVSVATSGCASFPWNGRERADRRATSRSLDGTGLGVRPVAYEEEADESITDSLSATYRALTGNAPDPDQAKQLLVEAEGLYQQAVDSRAQDPNGDHSAAFLAAAKQFRAAARKWPDSTVEQDALFLQGECYFFADRYPKAQDAYERLLDEYPNSRYLDRVQPRRFRIAEYWLALHSDEPQQVLTYNLRDSTRPGMDTFGRAIRIFDRIRLDDPTGKLADDATLAMANAFFNRGNFIRADEHYEDLRKTFPSSEHQFLAHLLGLKSKLLNYQGPDYSGHALVEAKKLLRQIRKQFPVESEREYEYLARAAKEIQYQLAAREWHLAEHYFRRAEYGAARFYYRTLASTYNDTAYVEPAQQRLASIGGQPDNPPQSLDWIVRLFPEEKRVQPLIQNGPVRR